MADPINEPVSSAKQPLLFFHIACVAPQEGERDLPHSDTTPLDPILTARQRGHLIVNTGLVKRVRSHRRRTGSGPFHGDSATFVPQVQDLASPWFEQWQQHQTGLCEGAGRDPQPAFPTDLRALTRGGISTRQRAEPLSPASKRKSARVCQSLPKLAPKEMPLFQPMEATKNLLEGFVLVGYAENNNPITWIRYSPLQFLPIRQLRDPAERALPDAICWHCFDCYSEAEWGLKVLSLHIDYSPFTAECGRGLLESVTIQQPAFGPLVRWTTLTKSNT
ncbi:hypothetical protein BGZ60DRAFT_523236 [Tricladium varicosporioides]|nr:hypothetical protein BGZ60DRAFT_523236 [Hymenoscyphus varicosporioides]